MTTCGTSSSEKEASLVHVYSGVELFERNICVHLRLCPSYSLPKVFAHGSLSFCLLPAYADKAISRFHAWQSSLLFAAIFVSPNLPLLARGPSLTLYQVLHLIFSWSSILSWMLFVVDIGLIGFLAMHAYQDGIIIPNPKSIPILIWRQLTVWIGLKFRSLGDWRVLSSTLNETYCIVSIHLETGVIAWQDTHVIILGGHQTALY